MRVRALDSDGDWTFGKGKNNYKKDLDAVMQNISTRIKSWKGNCFFSLEDHVDWENWFDINRKTLLDVDIKRVIMQTNGIIRLTSYESEIVDREFGMSATIVSIFGEATIAL